MSLAHKVSVNVAARIWAASYDSDLIVDRNIDLKQ
jgi:hypothetical protein